MPFDRASVGRDDRAAREPNERGRERKRRNVFVFRRGDAGR